MSEAIENLEKLLLEIKELQGRVAYIFPLRACDALWIWKKLDATEWWWERYDRIIEATWDMSEETCLELHSFPASDLFLQMKCNFEAGWELTEGELPPDLQHLYHKVYRKE